MSLGTVAITGATGFIGGHVIAALAARGWRQRLLIRRMSPLMPMAAGTEIVLGGLDDNQALARLVDGVDAVVHLAGAIKALRRETFVAVNRDGTARLLAACRSQERLRAVLVLSSLAAREPALSPYAASKHAAEIVLRDAGSGMPWVALRAPAVYGPGDRETLAFFRMVRHGLAVVAGSGAGRLSLIHATDLAAAIGDMLVRPPAPDVYEIDDGSVTGYGLDELAAIAGNVLGRRPRVVPLPRGVMSAAAVLTQLGARMIGAPAILSHGKISEMWHSDWVAHDRRLSTWLGFRPRFDARSGFADTISWYHSHNWL
jgi:nucleoside-diphosphate-sugar epimerase